MKLYSGDLWGQDRDIICACFDTWINTSALMHLSSASSRGGGGGGLMWGNVRTLQQISALVVGEMWGIRFLNAVLSGRMWGRCFCSTERRLGTIDCSRWRRRRRRYVLGRGLLGSTVSGWLGWLSCFVFYWQKTVFGWFGCSTFSACIKQGWNGWKSIGSACCCFSGLKKLLHPPCLPSESTDRKVTR